MIFYQVNDSVTVFDPAAAQVALANSGVSRAVCIPDLMRTGQEDTLDDLLRPLTSGMLEP